jgi:hypothetical protein
VGAVGALEIDDLVARGRGFESGVMTADGGVAHDDAVRLDPADGVLAVAELDAALEVVTVNLDEADAQPFGGLGQ